jgi:hypothetical protein
MSGIYRIDIDNPSKPPFDKGGFIFELFLSRLQQETLAAPFRNKGDKGLYLYNKRPLHIGAVFWM